MKKTISMFSKQIFGVHYESIGKSIAACMIVYASILAGEIRIKVAPFILFLTATAFTIGVMWQALNSSRNAENLTGVLMLPFQNKSFIFSYVGTLSCYTIVTKTALLLSLLFAVKDWDILQIAVTLVCACNACVVTAVLYSRLKRSRIFAVLWIAVIIATILWVRSADIVFCIAFISLLFGLFCLYRTDAYQFYHSAQASVVVKHHSKKGDVFTYLFRYLLAHKNYLVNTVGLCGIACFLPLLIGSFKGLNMIPFGFAILSLNTPICILLSCDPDLEQVLRILPRQKLKFYVSYCLFIFLFNFSVCSIFLISWWGIKHYFDIWAIVTAAIFSLQSAILSVMLEWFIPIRNWKIESDLWHHPRKYIVPVIMLILAVTVSTFPAFTIPLLAFVLLESLTLMLKIRR
jgi:hypothetical protein